MVTPINTCGSGTSSSGVRYTIPTTAPLFMNAPVASIVSVSLIRMTWAAITSNSHTGGASILSYELSYSELGLNSFTVISDSNVLSFDQTN